SYEHLPEEGVRRRRVRQRRRLSEPHGVPPRVQGSAPVRRLPGEPGASPRTLGRAQERSGPGSSAAPVLRLRSERAMLPVQGVLEAEALRCGREGGLRRRVQAEEVSVLSEGERARPQLHEEEAEPWTMAQSLPVGAPLTARAKIALDRFMHLSA